MSVVAEPLSEASARGVDRRRGAAIVAALAVLAALALLGPEWLRVAPAWLDLGFVGAIDRGLTWFAKEATVGGAPVQDWTRGFAALMNAPIDAAQTVLAEGLSAGRGLDRAQVVPPLSWLAIGGAAVLLGHRLGGRGLALTVAIAVAYLVVFGLWKNAMVTLASVLVSAAIATGLGLALGIWSYRSAAVEQGVRALMNVMQTVPIFAYLIPTLLLFGYGPSAAMIATVAYALPPMVHNTAIALRSVTPEIVEAGRMAGCSDRQLLWKVKLPVAVPQLSVGLNQVVMMTLNMVIIASMIGAGGLGYDVLTALRKLDIGLGLEAGMGIVALAVVLDRLTQAAAARGAAAAGRREGAWPLWRLLGLWLVAATLVALILPVAQAWPKAWTISTAPFWNGFVTWLNVAAYEAIEAFRTVVLLYVLRPLRDLLAIAPWSLVLGATVAAGAWLGGAALALRVGLLGLFVVTSGFWPSAANSLYLTLVSVALALAVGFPIGVWLALTPRAQKSAEFALDTLQTLPTLVYLLPAVMLFKIGDVSAVIAIASYALAPAIRYTMIGLSRTPPERLEAAAMAGCTPGQMLRLVRLPAAFPTLVLGLNQTVMMALSMLVIAALVGTKDLGQDVLVALNQTKIGQGVVAGLCVAAIALIADALLQAWAVRSAARMRT